MRSNPRGAHFPKLATLTAIALVSCSPIEVDTVIYDRFPSPNYDVDAIIVTTDAGATTSTGCHLVLVKRGDTPDPMDSVITGDKMEDSRIVVEWKGADIFVDWPKCQLIRMKDTVSINGQVFRMHFKFDKDQEKLK